MHASIDAYLSGATGYIVGCSLYLKTQGSRSTYLQLIREESVENRECIAQHLQQWKRNHVPATAMRNTATDKISVQGLRPPAQLREFPTEEVSPLKKKLLADRQPLYRKRGHLHGGLHQATTDARRYELASAILKLQDEINAINRDLWYLDRGIIPQSYLKKTVSADTFAAVQNFKIYITRYRRRLEKETDPVKKQRFQERLEYYQNQLKNTHYE